MPQLQYLGDIPKQGNNDISALAQALQGGIAGYFGAKENRKKNELAQSEIDLKSKQLEHDYAKLDYDKRKDMYDTIIKLLPSVPPEKQQELTSSPEWTTLEKSLGVPSLSGTTVSPEKSKPSWGQEQEKEAVKANILRGRVGPKRDMYGISEPIILDTKEKVIDYITESGFDPNDPVFTDKLSQFNIEGVGGKRKSPYKEYPDAFQEGGVWKVMRGGKKYKVQE